MIASLFRSLNTERQRSKRNRKLETNPQHLAMLHAHDINKSTTSLQHFDKSTMSPQKVAQQMHNQSKKKIGYLQK